MVRMALNQGVKTNKTRPDPMFRLVRMANTGELAVNDPHIWLARRGTWAALKLAEIGLRTPDDDPLPVA